ncbi:MAG: hypothetical protein ABIV63_20985 [Caldimonas sp.]
MQTLDEMLSRHLLTSEQHGEIRAWIAELRTPQAILEMPSHLWRTLELASVLMGLDSDLTRPPLVGPDAD